MCAFNTVPSPVYTGSVLCGFLGLGSGAFWLITSAHRSVRVRCTSFGCHRRSVYLFRSYMFAGLIISAAPHIHVLMYVQYPASRFLASDLQRSVNPSFALLDSTSLLFDNTYLVFDDFGFSEMTRSQYFTEVPLRHSISGIQRYCVAKSFPFNSIMAPFYQSYASSVSFSIFSTWSIL